MERRIIEEQLFVSSTIHSLQWHNTLVTSTNSTLAPFNVMNDAYHFFTHAVCRVFQGLRVQFCAGALACLEVPSHDDFPDFGKIKNIILF